MTMVISLAYLVNMTRDDMRYVQGKTAKFCANPGQDHFNALKHQLRFLKGTMNYGVEFRWQESDSEPPDLETQATAMTQTREGRRLGL